VQIALVTEGTYPCAYGGVSVWCDQLVRGMPEHRFHVQAITAAGGEPAVWELPANVTYSYLPLWGTPARGRPPAGRAARWFRTLFRALVEAILTKPNGSVPWRQTGVRFLDLVRNFTEILAELHEFAQAGALEAALRSEQAASWLLAAWAARRELSPREGIAATVGDALQAVSFLEHSLRPLSATMPASDVTHAVANGAAVLPGLAAKWRHQTPFVLTEHGIYLRERYLEHRGRPTCSWPVKAFMLNFLRLLSSAGYAAADLITPGNRYNQRWELRCGADPRRIQTVYNGVDPEHFASAGGEPAEATISWAGRIDPIKDLETLIRAFALVITSVPDARLRLFGGTPKGNEAYADRCRALAAELGLRERVSFEGRIANIRDAYTAGRIVVLSSISEGFPYTLIEAMTCSRATVATRVGGVPEAVADTGLVVPPRDPAAMAAACVRLLRDDLLRRRLAAAARHRALELFTVDRATGSFRTIYADLAAGAVPATSPAAAAPPSRGTSARTGAGLLARA
jgi:glycosyltransferase involved in cell wall biosynthesis